MRELRKNQFESLKESFAYYDLQWCPALVIDINQVPSRKITSSRGRVNFVEDNVINVIRENSLILVFASAKNPGGGIRNGAKAQQEDISLHTSWYYHIKNVKGFYLRVGDSAINTDKMLYVKNAHLLKDKYHNDIKPVPISLIGATAPNISGMQSQGQSVKKVYDIMAQRVENILKFAQTTGNKNLILGAWGCGVFGLDSQKIAKIFKEKIDLNFYNGDITFSIMDKKTMEIFKKYLQV